LETDSGEAVSSESESELDEDIVAANNNNNASRPQYLGIMLVSILSFELSVD
jgi:hypothetical protein